MKRFACAVVAALIAVACSSSEGTSIPDSTPGSKTDPTDPNNPSNPSKPSNPSTPGKPTDPNPSPATMADCDAMASAFCQRLSTCDHLVTKLLGSVATCAERYSRHCVNGAAAPGSGLTHAAVATCTPGIANTSCDDLTGGGAKALGPAGCSFEGTLADASKCAFGQQCKSGSCTAQDGQCGVCEPVAALGGSCAGSITCAARAYCNVSTGKCALRTALGQACGTGSGDHCVENGSCVNGICTAFGSTGQACDKNGVTAPMCDLSNGSACIGSPNKCTPFPITKSLGATCGFDASNLTLCGPGLSCAYGTNGSGTCIAETPEGGACAPGPNGGSSTCALALECIGGTCAYTTAAVCN